MDQPTADIVDVSGSITDAATATSRRAGYGVVFVKRFELAAMASGWTLAGVCQSGRHP